MKRLVRNIIMLSDRERLITLNLIPEIGSTQLRRLLDACGSLDRVWSASAQELQQIDGIGPRAASRIAAACQDEDALTQELALARAHQVELVTLGEAGYPAALKTISDPPLALYIRGRLLKEDVTAVGLVGSRHASIYGMQTAEHLGYELALRGVTIISGLARGIDGAAHRGALKANGRTLAVLGNGLAHIYPQEHESLAASVSEHGAVLSEYPMQASPLPHHFPRRNRLISGLSLGVVVVEAAARSGALITADCALEQGREVFAVPGQITTITSQGTHHLLKQGARLVSSVDDILEELRLAPMGGPEVLSASAGPSLALPTREQQVLACVGAEEPTYIDAIAARSALETAEVSALLLQLELKRLIQQLPGKQFIRRR